MLHPILQPLKGLKNAGVTTVCHGFHYTGAQKNIYNGFMTGARFS